MRKNSKHFREAVGDISLEGGFILVTKQLVIFWGSTSTLSIYQKQKHSSFRHSECHSSRIISLIWQIPNQYHHVNTKTIVKSQFVRTHFWNSKVLNHLKKMLIRPRIITRPPRTDFRPSVHLSTSDHIFKFLMVRRPNPSMSWTVRDRPPSITVHPWRITTVRCLNPSTGLTVRLRPPIKNL